MEAEQLELHVISLRGANQASVLHTVLLFKIGECMEVAQWGMLLRQAWPQACLEAWFPVLDRADQAQ
jgi:hypothetical protein